MTCDQVRHRLSDFLDGSLDDAERAAVSAHVGRCPRCAAEAGGLRETIALLRSLPPRQAPPELLGRIAGAVGRSGTGTQPSIWRTLFLPAHVKIPLEAAAAVLLFLLVYGFPAGAPRPQAASPAPPPPAVVGTAPTETAEIPAVAGEAARQGRSSAAAGEETDRRRLGTAADTAAGGASDPAGDTAPDPAGGPDAPPAPPQPAAQAPPYLPPATLASTEGRPVAPAPRAWEPRASAPPGRVDPGRLLAAPPPRLLRPPSHGLEIVLEIATDVREGVEERIALAALRLGGSLVREPFHGGGWGIPETPSQTVRVIVPAAAAEAFLAELRRIGTVPDEGSPAVTDPPAGPSADTVACTVHIRAR